MQFAKVGTESGAIQGGEFFTSNVVSHRDNIPKAHWDKTENPEYNPEDPDSPQYIFTNPFYEQKEDTPEESGWIFQQDGTWSADIAEYKKGQQSIVRTGCQDRIYSLYSKEYQQSCALGVYPPYVVDACTDTIASTIEEENRVHDAIEAATTIEEVNTAVASLVWPEVTVPVEPV